MLREEKSWIRFKDFVFEIDVAVGIGVEVAVAYVAVLAQADRTNKVMQRIIIIERVLMEPFTKIIAKLI